VAAPARPGPAAAGHPVGLPPRVLPEATALSAGPATAAPPAVPVVRRIEGQGLEGPEGPGAGHAGGLEVVALRPKAGGL
jgi:hypothetical protein